MDVKITVLGGFSVTVARAPVRPSAWGRRGAASLVKLLALADGRSLHREQVSDALWPEVPIETALPRLHKAAHYARRALGGAVVLRDDRVLLLPDDDVTVDAVEFRGRARAALAEGSAERGEQALKRYPGPLLPEDLYAPWTTEWRETLDLLRRDLLHLTGRWAELVREDPTDEAAHLALAREHAARGDLRAARRQLERMSQALRRELGTVPSAEARRLQAELAPAAPTGGANRLFGRRQAGDALREELARAAAGRGRAVLITGATGVGKTALVGLAEELAQRRGWRVARGTAAAIEGAWPYAPVLEAYADLCRQHPTLLDGLGDDYRRELDRALSGEQSPWTGESGHQRLFVAAAELLRLAASGHGLLLAVDDVHEADEASLRLLHYLTRCAVGEPVLVLMTSRPGGAERDVVASLVGRGFGRVLDLPPLDQAATRRLLAHHHPDLDDDTLDEVWTVSGGVPFRALEAARAAGRGPGGIAVAGLADGVLAVLRRVALLGSVFSTDELLAVAGTDEEAAYAALDAGLRGAVVEPTEAGYRFRHVLVREALLSTFAPHERARAGGEVADRLADLGAPPTRIARLLVSSGHPVRAVPYVRAAVETAGALGAYRDGLTLIDAVLDHASGADRGHLLARRGDLLLAVADPDAVTAYRAAVSVTTGTEHRLVRARLARAAAYQGDLETAESALAGLEPVGDDADAPVLLARGALAWFSGDVVTAREAADAARATLPPGDSWQTSDLVALQGLIAHEQGEWFQRFRLELRRTRDDPGLATAVFDAHLCVAEYLLYGPVPYAEVVTLAEGLRRRAERHGTLRGVAFATALIGESALLMGDLDTAERELREAVELHHDLDATAGEAHSLQRLAQVRLARGDRRGAQELLARALPLARWSIVARHLLQRLYATMIAAAPDRFTARAVVDQAEAALGASDHCEFCDIMLAVPAAIACADAGDLGAARCYLDQAQASRTPETSTAWAGAIAEARAHLAAAEHDDATYRRELAEAARLFTLAGQPLDTARCQVPVPAASAG